MGLFDTPLGHILAAAVIAISIIAVLDVIANIRI
jgi:hypothetical protein